MRALILATASVLALGIGGAGAASAHGYSGSSMGPNAGKTSNSKTYSKTSSRHRFSSRRGIKEAQEALRHDRLYRGPIDGLIGPMTRHALARFQKQNGLRVTASLDHSTMASLMGHKTSGSGSSRTNRHMTTGQTGNPGQMPPANGTGGQGTGTGTGSGTMNSGTNSGTTR